MKRSNTFQTQTSIYILPLNSSSALMGTQMPVSLRFVDLVPLKKSASLVTQAALCDRRLKPEYRTSLNSDGGRPISAAFLMQFPFELAIVFAIFQHANQPKPVRNDNSSSRVASH